VIGVPLLFLGNRVQRREDTAPRVVKWQVRELPTAFALPLKNLGMSPAGQNQSAVPSVSHDFSAPPSAQGNIMLPSGPARAGPEFRAQPRGRERIMKVS
jgi:hypothetical protein